MGFAKYMEDNYSRYHGASIVRGREHDPFVGGADTRKEEKEADKMKEQSSKLKDFTVAEARPMPVIVMADVSGSMSVDGKIEALNLALKDMIAGFAAESRIRAEIQVGLITFGGEDARMHLPLVPAHRISEVSPLAAAGRTPMGAAFEQAMKLLEDKEKISSRAYRPVLVLVSDGMRLTIGRLRSTHCVSPSAVRRRLVLRWRSVPMLTSACSSALRTTRSLGFQGT